MVWKQRPLEAFPSRRTLALRLAALGLLFAALLAASVVGGVRYFRASEPSDPLARLADRYRYDFLGWELRNFPNMFLYKLGHLFVTPDKESNQLTIEEYFQTTSDINRLEASNGDPAQLANLRSRRAGLENRVENILEGEIVGLLRDEGITVSPPIFKGIDMLFPPVDFELDEPPKVLAVSPRDRIALSDSYELRTGLSEEAVQDIEQQAEATGVSAVVLDLGGIATYPAVVPALDSFRCVVHTAVHEWAHHYLAMYPLGQSYFSSPGARTMNETVADMVADELTPLILRIHPLPGSGTQAAAIDPSFDFGAQMRQLRLEVDDLLARDEITQAEKLMELRRRVFAFNGFYIRKLNQAYLAFNNFYAAQPGSIDPTGAKMKELRARSGTLANFMSRVSQLTTVEELDALLRSG
ncbi:MAG TPA: hypothetical protein VFB90_09005 [Dehalococcoidia bacterium]|nr:hypothetical protein [Dehalococcoidia bacterium]